MKKLITILALGVLACASTQPRERVNLYPTVEAIPTQTPVIIYVSQTPNPTYTPVFVEVTSTPNALCVSANETVNLRPSPNTDNYPIVQIPNGAKVKDLGGRNESWYLVEYLDYQGWINSDYLEDC